MAKKIELSEHFTVDDVFEDSEIVEYVERALKVGDVFKDTEIKEYIAENAEPEDVFSVKELEAWAESNGYEKKES